MDVTTMPKTFVRMNEEPVASAKATSNNRLNYLMNHIHLHSTRRWILQERRVGNAKNFFSIVPPRLLYSLYAEHIEDYSGPGWYESMCHWQTAPDMEQMLNGILLGLKERAYAVR